MTEPKFSGEADADVARALEHIEKAQRELDRACQALSPRQGGGTGAMSLQSRPPAATGTPADEAPAKSDVASDSSKGDQP